MAMIGATLAQLRFTASLVFGWSFDLRALDRLVDAMQETQREFGAVGPDAGDLLGGPPLDDDTRREVQVRRFRTQAVRAARETAYYGLLFARLGLDPARLRYDDLVRLPRTPKDDLREDPDAFVRRTARPTFRTT